MLSAHSEDGPWLRFCSIIRRNVVIPKSTVSKQAEVIV